MRKRTLVTHAGRNVEIIKTVCLCALMKILSCTNVCVCVCMYVCMYVCVCMHMYVWYEKRTI